jgi:hypothetical protein
MGSVMMAFAKAESSTKSRGCILVAVPIREGVEGMRAKAW